MAAWRTDGRLKTREEVVKGSVEDFVAALNKLFRGENKGKLVLEIAES
jgi:NADPH-dependent curcumin reductase CurA